MNPQQSLSGRILGPQGWVRGHLELQADGRIAALHEDASAPVDRLILPGFVDLHVHGGLGVDIMEGGESARTVARAHARHGTTSLLATTMTAPQGDIERALQGIGAVMAEPQAEEARIIGVHLEGPYLSSRRLGAQPDIVSRATLEAVQAFSALAAIKVLTLAPEIPGHLALIPELSALGIRVQIGHSAGSYEDGVAALKAGVAGFTHLFNGMPGLNHYEPGMVGAALAHAEYAELIPDLQHVHPGAMRAALRAIPKLYCVTDATAATGMPDGEYSLGSQRVLKCLGCVRLATGSLAGSALTMDQALRNLVEVGLSVEDASARLSRNPADYLGLAERGRLQAGAWADVVVFDPELQLQQVWVQGQPVSLN
ncbi:N-acetylglucosamine-6-phosphate deacetylase [Roseateles sp.]|uniref:N-acetylglucosamine-6-phosphate deacetylase n=1 Tax=Roseateles sp. TaxID=1971397 RepID=UPI003D10D8DB